jgi:ABC-type branched-subunit amino acid transport system substrate-binding protein
MAISETSLRDILLFAFDEINKKGGVKWARRSNPCRRRRLQLAALRRKGQATPREDKVAVVFGCWTSVSRKSVLPVFEKDNGMLFYPVQYEGEELSKNIFYTAEAVNQQATPRSITSSPRARRSSTSSAPITFIRRPPTSSSRVPRVQGRSARGHRRRPAQG